MHSTLAAIEHDHMVLYFRWIMQVEIISKGAEGYIGVGFQTEDVNLARLPGWEHHSYGMYWMVDYDIACQQL